MKIGLSYDEWMTWKHKRARFFVELIPWDDPLYSAQSAINEVCFDGGLRFLRLMYIPDDLAARHQANGVYGYGVIMLDKAYHRQHGVDDEMINLLYHECLHAFCDNPNPFNRIIDTDLSGNHLQTFAFICENHGGECPTDDYAKTRLSAASMARIREYIEKEGLRNGV